MLIIKLITYHTSGGAPTTTAYVLKIIGVTTAASLLYIKNVLEIRKNINIYLLRITYSIEE